MENLSKDWDLAQLKLGASIVQGGAWAEFQESLGHKVYYDSSKDWSWVGYGRNAKGLKHLFLPYGPTIKSDPEGCLKSIVEKAKQNSFDFVRLEPLGNLDSKELAKFGAKKVKDVEPSHTLVLDLEKPLDELRQELNSGHRNLINGTQRRGLTITTSQSDSDYAEFLKMLHDTSSRAGVNFHSDEYLLEIFKVLGKRKVASLYIAKKDTQPVAAALFYDYADVRYYAHAGAYQELNRKYNASVSLLWQAILDAKEAKMTSFDMWGVAPSDDPNHKWAGITKFKKGFGGKEVSYLGTYDVPINKLKYKLYSASKKIMGKSL